MGNKLKGENMLILILIALAALFTLPCVLIARDVLDYDGEAIAGASMTFIGIMFIAAVITLCVGIVKINSAKKIDAKIEMYSTENAKIETQITEAVEKYLEHELNIYDSLQGEDIQTLLVVYPELNSNELVKKQIEIFVENNQQIKKLKNKKLNINTWKFVVYFGG